MLLRNIDQLFRDPQAFGIILLALVLSLLIAITVHEASHALAAYSLGDSTAKKLGRLTLNPIAHLDPAGTLMLFLAGFGWGKPVPVNPYLLRKANRQGMALVAAAGPLSNIITAAIFSIPIRMGYAGLFEGLFFFIVFFNLLLAVFNLLPIYPLDGFKLALGILPGNIASSFSGLEKYGPGILLLVIILDIVTGVGILSRVLGPIVNVLLETLLSRQFF